MPFGKCMATVLCPVNTDYDRKTELVTHPMSGVNPNAMPGMVGWDGGSHTETSGRRPTRDMNVNSEEKNRAGRHAILKIRKCENAEMSR